jgi:hypothetical protein
VDIGTVGLFADRMKTKPSEQILEFLVALTTWRLYD